MANHFISSSIQDKNVILTLNRPKAYNALDLEMVEMLRMRLKEWQQDPAIQFIILQSSMDTVFCAGGDIKAAYQKQNDPNYTHTFFPVEYELNGVISNYPKPIIALINGLTLGGGMGLTIHASHRIINENALLGMPETTIGFFPDVGCGYFYNKLPEPLGLYFALTGDLINPCEAIKTGLATHYVPSSKWEFLRNSLKECNDKIDIEKCLGQYHEAQDLSLAFPYFDAIEKFFSAKSVEEILERLKNHPSSFAQECHQKLITKSPTSLKVTFKKFKQNKGWPLKAVLEQDFALSQNFIHHPDMKEGIRAQIIDKDKSPKWNPSTLEDVTEEMVERLFNIKK